VKRLLIVAVWALATAWFVRFEAFPEYFTHSMRGYRDLIPHGIVEKDSWMKLLLKNTPVGYSHTRIGTDEGNVSSRYLVENLTRLNINLMGMQESITVSTDVKLDALYHLTSFRMSVISRHSATIVSGRRRSGDLFAVTVDTGGNKDRRTVKIPDDIVIYSQGMDLALSRMTPGDSITFRTLEPLTLNPVAITARALPRELITFGAIRTNVAVFAIDYMGSSSRSWVGDDGRVLRTETLLKDLIAEACEPDEAINSASQHVDAEDLILDMAVHPNVVITNPRHCSFLNLHVSGVPAKTPGVKSNRQIPEWQTDGSLLLTTRAALIPAPCHDFPQAPLPEDMQIHLKASSFIQSDHPDIVRLAKSLTSGKTNTMDAAIAICNWVHDNLEKVPSPGVPSAIEVLRSRKGDCNEHTYLFVALARAAGIPSNVKIGLVYSETYEAFCYHAWPAVFAGDWVEMDPTFGQTTVDASHIALIEGEFAEQFALAQMVGRLNITVIKQESQ